MRSIFLFLLLTSFTAIYSQPNTDVFLFELNIEDNKFELSNFKNISNNEGYDNQPSFLDDNSILYAGTRNGQTDIVKYNIKYDSKIFINYTEGSEYSPLKIPNNKAVSAIRLEKNGEQILYKYDLKNGESEKLINDIVIGYHVWQNENLLVSSVLEDNGLSLYMTDISKKENRKLDSNIGRSLHNIPNTKLISYISKSNENWNINSVNPITGSVKSIVKTINNQSEDMCWLPDGTILMGFENKLYTYKPNIDNNWKEVASLETYKIENITRLAISPDGKNLAIVGEGGKVKKNHHEKLEHKLENINWISGNWKGEALGGNVEENWSEPSGGSMMATFKLIKDNEIVFYEIEIIREVNNTLILQLKHFNNDLKGWESKDDTVDFPLKEITPNKVIFEGMTFERINEKEMNVYVDMHNNDGTKNTLKFNYKKD